MFTPLASEDEETDTLSTLLAVRRDGAQYAWHLEAAP